VARAPALPASLAISAAFSEAMACNNVVTPSMNAPLDKDLANRPSITMRDLYPPLSEVELKEAADHFHRYCEIALQIHEEHHSVASGQFDTSHNLSSMKERSNVPLKEIV
jgi:hypothetical protein